MIVWPDVFSLRIRNARSSTANIAFNGEMVVAIPIMTNLDWDSSLWEFYRASQILLYKFRAERADLAVVFYIC